MEIVCLQGEMRFYKKIRVFVLRQIKEDFSGIIDRG
jgi:hypothetical protein